MIESSVIAMVIVSSSSSSLSLSLFFFFFFFFFQIRDTMGLPINILRVIFWGKAEVHYMSLRLLFDWFNALNRQTKRPKNSALNRFHVFFFLDLFGPFKF
jgi:hypothetical protein